MTDDADDRDDKCALFQGCGDRAMGCSNAPDKYGSAIACVMRGDAPVETWPDHESEGEGDGGRVVGI